MLSDFFCGDRPIKLAHCKTMIIINKQFELGRVAPLIHRNHTMYPKEDQFSLLVQKCVFLESGCQ
jgi:hypothetical protein